MENLISGRLSSEDSIKTNEGKYKEEIMLKRMLRKKEKKLKKKEQGNLVIHEISRRTKA